MLEQSALRLLPALLPLLFAGAGCIAPPAVATALPSSLYQRSHCPALEVRVVEEFKKSLRAWGILFVPFTGDLDVAGLVNAEVGRLQGDAAIDVQVRSDWRGVLYLFFGIDFYPRVEVSGKVVRFVGEACPAGGARS